MQTDLNSVKITELGLSPAIIRSLESGDITTAGQLVAATDETLLSLDSLGKAKVARIREALAAYGETAPKEPRKPAQRPPTFTEERQAEAIQRLQESALKSQQMVKEREKQLQALCDALVTVGNDPVELRQYYPEYQSPEERGV